jgi:hypothetical protein
MVPFVIGLLVGAGLTKNRYVWILVISYVVIVTLLQIFAKSIIKVKESTDKKLAMKDLLLDGVDNIGTATYRGNKLGEELFDKIYPNYVLLLNFRLNF